MLFCILFQALMLINSQDLISSCYAVHCTLVKRGYSKITVPGCGESPLGVP